MKFQEGDWVVTKSLISSHLFKLSEAELHLIVDPEEYRFATLADFDYVVDSTRRELLDAQVKYDQALINAKNGRNWLILKEKREEAEKDG